jgi:hypothetical protein
MTKRVPDISLSVTIIIVLSWIQKGCSCLKCIIHNRINIVNKKTNKSCNTIYSIRLKLSFQRAFFMQMKNCSINREFSYMYAAIFISPLLNFNCSKCFGIKRYVSDTTWNKKLCNRFKVSFFTRTCRYLFPGLTKSEGVSIKFI